jgi:putative beta-lysine N-acetyltransferase
MGKLSKSEDTVIPVGKSIIQHGPRNDRVCLVHLHPFDFPGILPTLKELRKLNKYTKITARVPMRYVPSFQRDAYVMEAIIPGYYPDGEDCVWVSFFAKKKRQKPSKAEFLSLQTLLESEPGQKGQLEEFDGTLSILEEKDTLLAAKLYRLNKTIWAFPLDEPKFLEKMAGEGTLLIGGWGPEGELLGVITCEKDKQANAAEIGNLALNPRNENENMPKLMLTAAENKARGKGAELAYSYAPLTDDKYNQLLHMAGYRYAGALIKNANYNNQLVSQAVWYKRL